MVCRYEKTTTARIAAMTKAIGLAKPSAADPASTSTRRISSVAYATDESASEERTARPVTRERRSCWARCDGIGFPTTNRLNCESSPSSGTTYLPTAGGVSWRARGWKSSTVRLRHVASAGPDAPQEARPRSRPPSDPPRRPDQPGDLGHFQFDRSARRLARSRRFRYFLGLS